MKKVWKRLIAVSLSLMLMFTMGINVFAAEGVEGTPGDNPAVTLDEGDAAVTEAEPAEEAVTQEEEPEVTALDAEPIEEEGSESVELADGTYNATGLSTAVLNMYHFHDPQVVVRGDDAWLITTEDTGNTVKRFDGMAYGPQSQILDSADPTNHTLVEGTVTATVVPIYNEDGTLQTRTFVLPVPKSVLEAGDDIYYMVKYTEGYSAAHDGDWYKASGGDYYLTGYTLEKVSDKTTLPGEPEPVDLEITNNTGMFKAVTAHLITEQDQEYLVMALSGSGYRELYKGTYEAAVANGDGSEANGNDTWIHGYQNADNYWEFKIPLSAEETYVPVVAVSNSYYNKYLAGTNSLARAFYPRQFTLDRDAKTLVTGDYEYTKNLEVTNNIKMFKTPTAKIETVGGPNSNNYKSNLILTMQNDSYDKLYVGTYQEAAAADVTVALDENKEFTVPVRWVEAFGNPETMKTLIGEPFKVSFCSKKNGTWYERTATINEEEGTLVLDDVLADYTAVDAAIAAVPEDLSIYTDGTAQAVQDAVAAVKTGKNIAEQEAVNAMATAINTAVAALEEKTDISDAVVAAIPAQTYNGKAKTPDVKVTVGETELVKDTDYTVVYKNNTNAGKATVTVTGIGNYAGEKAAEFTINPAGQTLKVSTAQKTVKFKKLKKKAQTTSKVAVSGAKTKVTYAKVGGSKKLSINKNTGKITVKKKTKKGTYTIKVKVTAAKSANYKAAAKTATIKVKVKK